MSDQSKIEMVRSAGVFAKEWSSLWASASHLADVESRAAAHVEVSSGRVVRGILRTDGGVLGFVGRVDPDPSGLYRFAHCQIPAIVSSSFEVPYGGLGVAGRVWELGHLEELASELATALRVPRVGFSKVARDVYTEHSNAVGSGRLGKRLGRVRRLPTFEMRLCSTTQESLSHLNKKRRYGFRRQLKRVMELGSSTIEYYDQAAGAEDVMKAILPVSEATYQSKLGTTVFNSSARRRQVIRAIEAGLGMVAILRCSSEVVAYQIGSVIDKEYRLEELGYRADYAEYSPGASLLYASIDRLVELGIQRLDFGEGRSQYKDVLATGTSEVCTFVFHDNSLRGRAIKIVGPGATALDRSIRRLVPAAATARVKSTVKKALRRS